MPIAGLEGQLAVHENVRPDDIYFVTERPLVVVRPRKDIHSLCGTIPVILVLARFRLVAHISIWLSLVRLVERSLEEWGNGVDEYRYTGVSSPMLLPITEAWCIDYTLLFDPQKVLRYWLRKDCG